jgi:hypothetical protein
MTYATARKAGRRQARRGRGQPQYFQHMWELRVKSGGRRGEGGRPGGSEHPQSPPKDIRLDDQCSVDKGARGAHARAQGGHAGRAVTNRLGSPIPVSAHTSPDGRRRVGFGWVNRVTVGSTTLFPSYPHATGGLSWAKGASGGGFGCCAHIWPRISQKGLRHPGFQPPPLSFRRLWRPLCSGPQTGCCGFRVLWGAAGGGGAPVFAGVCWLMVCL